MSNGAKLDSIKWDFSFCVKENCVRELGRGRRREKEKEEEEEKEKGGKGEERKEGKTEIRGTF